MELNSHRERGMEIIFSLGTEGMVLAQNFDFDETAKVVLKKRQNKLSIVPFLTEFKDDVLNLDSPMTEQQFTSIKKVAKERGLTMPDKVLSQGSKSFALGFTLFAIFGSLAIISSFWGLGELSGWWFLVSAALVVFYFIIMTIIKLPRVDYTPKTTAKEYMAKLALFNNLQHPEVFKVQEKDLEDIQSIISGL